MLHITRTVTNYGLVTAYFNSTGRRVAIKLGNVGDNVQGKTDYIYNLSGQLISEVTDNTYKDYVYFNGQPFAMIENGQVYYYHNNHLGSPEVLTDKNKSVVWKASYSPYGEASISTEAVTNNIRLPGQYFDAESGLHYNYFRYYDSSTGRYVTSDPIGLAGGINTYGYVLGNPVNLVDPTGEFAVPILRGLYVLGTIIACKVSGLCDSISDGIDSLESRSNGEQCPPNDSDADEDIEEECLDEIQDCRQHCIIARENKHRMPLVWGDSWWRCMTGCVSFECQDYLDERKHGEY